MLPQHVLIAIIAAVGAVPLNINLGAYSPALVVGDGEISLGSSESASELMATLASGAASNQPGEQGQQGQQQQGGGEQQQQQGGEQQQQEGGEQQQEGQQEGGEGEQQQQEQPAEENAAKRAMSPNLIRTVDPIGKRAPVADEQIAAIEGAMRWIKRDLQGFNAALSYAREAQKDAPKVELGTGEEGSGVGIIVNAGLNVPANSAANGQPAGGERKLRKKRSEVVAEDSEAPKMTLVAITEV